MRIQRPNARARALSREDDGPTQVRSATTKTKARPKGQGKSTDSKTQWQASLHHDGGGGSVEAIMVEVLAHNEKVSLHCTGRAEVFIALWW